MEPADFFKNQRGSHFVSKEQFLEVLDEQLDLGPVCIQQLRSFGVAASEEICIDFFFTSHSYQNSKLLVRELKEVGYEAGFGKSPGEKERFLIAGTTCPMAVTEESILPWTMRMCELAYQYDCLFEGWGTSVK